jgi:mRNA interferase MazF
MQSTTTYSRGTVVLVPFPFTDLSGVKNRPALVVSAEEYNDTTGDLILAQITGNLAARPRLGDYPIPRWLQAGLRAPSMVRAKLVTLEQTRIRRVLGQILPVEMTAVEQSLRTALNLP